MASCANQDPRKRFRPRGSQIRNRGATPTSRGRAPSLVGRLTSAPWRIRNSAASVLLATMLSCSSVMPFGRGDSTSKWAKASKQMGGNPLPNYSIHGVPALAATSRDASSRFCFCSALASAERPSLSRALTSARPVPSSCCTTARRVETKGGEGRGYLNQTCDADPPPTVL